MNRAQTCLALLASLLLSVACVPADDGFRARLAAGCNSEETCSALSEDADKRWGDCIRASSTGRGCNEQMTDKFAASEMKQRQQETGANSRSAPLLAEEKRAQDAEQKRLVELQLGQQAELDRRECDTLSPVLNKPHLTPQGLSGVADLSDARLAADREADSQHEAIAKLRKCDPARADRLAPDIDTWIAQVARAIDDEEACRKTPSCMAPRLVEPICEAISDRRFARKAITTERQNPAGVIDLRALHDFGQEIQNDDATIADLKTQYRALTHKSFNESRCPKVTPF